MVLVVIVVLSAPAAHHSLELPNRKVVVFRHHPGLIDTKENAAARDRDAEAILGALEDADIGYRYAGGLGRGYELSVRTADLVRWKKLVDGLVARKALGYYGWGAKE